MSDIRLYGIKNCDQIKKARRWLDDQQVGYHFHDYRVDGVPQAVADWLAEAGAQVLINRQSSSWRGLSDDEKAAVSAGETDTILSLLHATPTLIKRPLLVVGKQLTIGFDAAHWHHLIHSREG